jgi:hypothetical protein
VTAREKLDEARRKRTAERAWRCVQQEQPGAIQLVLETRAQRMDGRGAGGGVSGGAVGTMNADTARTTKARARRVRRALPSCVNV